MSLKWNNNNLNEAFGFNLGRLYQKENIFHAIYILDSLSGALFVSNKYSDKFDYNDTPEDLISSFLNAMNLFINEINEDEEIQEINFKHMRILYERRERLMIIAISKKTNLEVEKHFISEILNDFYQRFEHKINKFNGMIDPAMIKYKNRLKEFDLSKPTYRHDLL